jgi:hypothetical protein
MEAPTPAAPAQPTAPDTVSASIDAVNRRDFDAFDRAELGKRTGAPLADVPVSPVDAGADPASPPVGESETGTTRTLSKRQQQTNDAIRQAVDRATQADKDRIAALERQLAERPAPPAARAAAPAEPAAPPAPKTAEYKRYQAMPDAPKVEDFDSLIDHSAAMAVFIADKRYDERAAQESQTQSRTEREHQRVTGFLKQVTEAKADPEFVAAVTPEVAARFKTLKPFASLNDGEVGGPRNFIAEQIYDSPSVKSVLLHFAQHPDELDRLEAGPAQLAGIPLDRRTDAHHLFHMRWIEHEFKRLEGRLAGSVPSAPSTAAAPAPASPAAVSSPITAAPPPPPTLRAAGNTSDPKAAALARRDFAEYDRLETEERMAKLQPRR